MKTRRRPLRHHWYRWHIGECCVCGRAQSYREGVYGSRPRRHKDRLRYLPDTYTYCGCLER